MDPRHPRSGAHASHPVTDMSASVRTPDDSRTAVTQSLGGHAPPTTHTALAAKDAIISAPQGVPALEDGVVRESWVSFASTAASRDSAAPSIFSVRASTASAATRYSVRQSLMESTVSPTSPEDREHRKSSFPQGPRYCCTFCDAAFDSNMEWKIHELDAHDRRERYPCANCPAMFPGASLLDEHLRDNHGLDPVPNTAHAVRYSSIRSAWGCGFCAAFIPSRNDYLEHVGRHYDDGKEMSKWQHTRVIEGLLRQPKVEAAWAALVSREERAKGTKLRFLWTLSATGRTADALEEPRSLQDMLEFFATGQRMPDEIAAAAYRAAQVRHEANVSDLISKLYLRNPEPTRQGSIHRSAQPSPELRPASPATADDTMSPISPLPAPLRPLTAPPRPPNLSIMNHMAEGSVSDHPAASFEERLRRPPARQQAQLSHPQALATLQHPFKRSLRRVDSARALELSKRAGALPHIDAHGETAAPRTPSSKTSSSIPSPSMHRTELQPHFPARHGKLLGTSNGKPLLVATTSAHLSVRPHTSSSSLSTRTGDGSQGLCDSTSERMSDDSVSEPESWLEVDGIPAATRTWKRVFQQRVDSGMGQLWSRFNSDWDALVRQCIGDRSNNSAPYRDSGRVRKGSSSRHAPGRSLHPNARLPDQEDEGDDDEEESYRPPSSMSKRSSDSVKRFACPFRKHDPHTYNMQDHEVCTVRSWSTISRLKEHLYRRHYKTHCQRCKQAFGDAKELAVHEMAVVSCEFVDQPPPCDITAYQEKQLKSRKHTSRRQTDEEKWRDIYRLLFPNEEIPSPYPEPAEDMMPASSEFHASLNFQNFLLSEMPTLFTKTAEEHAGRRLQAPDALPMEAIPRIIEDALQKAFMSWEARGSELPNREASAARTSFLPETPTSLAYSYGQVTAYQTPQPLPVMDGYPHDQFSNTDFAPDASHVPRADDSGFGEAHFFTSGPPINFSTFAPQYERSPWDGGLSLMDTGAFDADLNMGGHFRGFQNR